MTISTEFNGYVYPVLEIGKNVVLTEPISNGLIQLEPLNRGKVIFNRGQGEATVWFPYLEVQVEEEISKALQTTSKPFQNGNVEGVAISVRKDSLAFQDRPDGAYRKVTVYETNAVKIPFFEIDEEKRLPQIFLQQKNGEEWGDIWGYNLEDVAAIVEKRFTAWVTLNISFRKITEEEYKKELYPDFVERRIIESHVELYEKKKREVRLAFAKQTGVHVEFAGGVNWFSLNPPTDL